MGKGAFRKMPIPRKIQAVLCVVLFERITIASVKLVGDDSGD